MARGRRARGAFAEPSALFGAGAVAGFGPGEVGGGAADERARVALWVGATLPGAVAAEPFPSDFAVDFLFGLGSASGADAAVSDLASGSAAADLLDGAFAAPEALAFVQAQLL